MDGLYEAGIAWIKETAELWQNKQMIGPRMYVMQLDDMVMTVDTDPFHRSFLITHLEDDRRQKFEKILPNDWTAIYNALKLEEVDE